MYAELHCHSVFSLLDGASEPEALLARAKALGMPSLALTDHDDLGGAVRFAQAAAELEIGGILGTELTLDVAGVPTHLVLLAEDRTGYGNIASLITRGRMDNPRGEPRVSLDVLARYTAGIFALTGCPRGWVPRRIAAGDHDGACEAAATLLDLFEGRLAIECWDHHLPEERELVRHLIPLAKSLGIPWVVTNDVHYALPTGRGTHDVLCALRHRETLDGMGTRLRPNGEWYLKGAEQLHRRWQLDEAGLRASVAIAERCAFRLADLRPTLPTFPLPPGVSADEYLERLVEQGAAERWGGGHLTAGPAAPPEGGGRAAAAPATSTTPGPPNRKGARGTWRNGTVGNGMMTEAGPHRGNFQAGGGPVPPQVLSLADLPAKYRTQITYELGVIRQLGLAGYFLIVWDIVRFAHRNGILCQGRGSAANSAVCYCLGITAIDPVRMELLFARFLSEDRTEAPDIDIDFAHRDRESVLQYVYERYGREHAAMVCEQITYRGRSAVRDAARVLGFSVQQADVLSALSDRFSAKATAEALRVGVSAEEMLGRHYDLDPQSDRPGVPDDPRKQPEEWSAEQLMSQRLGQGMVHGTESSTLTRASKEQGRRLALGIVPDGPKPRAAGSASSMPVTASPAMAPDSAARPKPSAHDDRPLTSRDRPRPTTALEPYGSPPARALAPRSSPLTPSHHDPHAPETHEERRNPVTALRQPPSPGVESILAQAGLDPDDRRVQVLPGIVEGLHQAPRHRSIHVGGFVLTAEPLCTVVPIEPASMPNRTVIQWEKDDLDPAGLVKIDLLGLGMLTVLQDCLKYIRATRGVAVDLAQLDMTDQAVYDDLCAADTIGVFQVESRAQMNTLPRLKPRNFYDLVVEVALIRPGPIQGDMVHPYLRRRAGEEEVTYPHPSLEPILKRTLGIPLFQEQGMQVAITAAGFTPGEADSLRRAMGHKRSRERMAAICQKLIEGMARNGIPEDIAKRIYNQINAFADYGFPESHSASFALIVYASAYLRHYYAAEFTAAILNAQPMGFYSVGTLIEDAKHHGVEVRAVDLTCSAWDHALECDGGRMIVPYDGVVRMREPETGTRDAGRDGEADAAERRKGEAGRQSPGRGSVSRNQARGAPPHVKNTSSPPTPPNHSIASPPNPSHAPAHNATLSAAISPRSHAPPSPTPRTALTPDSIGTTSRVPRHATRPPTVRLGLRLVKGLGARAREKLEAALLDGPFADIPDFIRRVQLDQPTLRSLCEAGAFDTMVADVPPQERRRVALWRVLDAVRGDAGPLAPRRVRRNDSAGRKLPPMTRLELTDADYRVTGVSLNGHPMHHLREILAPNGIRTAHDLHTRGRDGERAAHAGLVICRQRPGTAKGFVFLSLEDETGIVNVVVTPKRFEKQALLISTSPLLLVRGILQVEQKVVNLRGAEFRALRADAGEAWAKGHDFH